VHPSPSPLTQSGRAVLKETPDTPGSLGIAISEAVEVGFGICLKVRVQGVWPGVCCVDMAERGG
jgi:hypothetical protein